jgi:hypothetical protein
METAIVVLIVVAAVFFAGRAIVGIIAGRESCPGRCSGCGVKCREAEKGQQKDES